jgi:hypothetical protein
MSTPEWMQKFKQIGQKGEEEVTTVGEEGIVKTVEPPKVDRASVPPAAAAAAVVPTSDAPPLASQAGGGGNTPGDDDAAALFHSAGTSSSTGAISSGTSLGLNPSDDGSDDAAALFFAAGGGGGGAEPDPPSPAPSDGEGGAGGAAAASAVVDPSTSTADDDDAAAMFRSAGGSGVDGIGEEEAAAPSVAGDEGTSADNSWMVDKDKFLAEEMKQEFGEEEVTERNLGEEHYEDVYVDDDGNEVYVDEDGNEIQEEEVLLDEDGNEVPMEEEEFTDEAVAEVSAVAAASAVAAPPITMTPEPEPVFIQYDVEDQRRVLQTTAPGKRSRMSIFVPISAFLALVSAILLVVFLVGLDEDSKPSVQGPSMAPTPMQYLPLNPTSNGNIQAAATTRFDPVQNNCDFGGLVQPSFIDQCACVGAVDILADDVRARREDLMETFMPSVLPLWNETVSSCTAENQALLWLSSGINNGGEVSNLVRLQRYALAWLYVAQEGTQWRDNTGWLSERDVCEWSKVECDSNFYVQSLNLNNNRLMGQVS